VGVAIWVMRRHWRKEGGAWDYVYALLFVIFGITDFIESQVVPLWLIASKGLIFGGILIVRWIVVRQYYPGAKM